MTLLDQNPNGETCSFAGGKMTMSFPRATAEAQKDRVEGWQYPKRKGTEIFVPFQPMVQYFLIDHGNQVLIIVPDDAFSNPTFWLCGNPARPFLSQVKKSAASFYLRSGIEATFWQELKPQPIIRCETFYGVKTHWQGCLCVCNLGDILWEDLDRALWLIEGKKMVKHPTSPGTPHALFGSRHLLTGQYSNLDLFGALTQEIAIVSGTLTGPDDQTMELETPHLVCRSEGFVVE